MGCTCNWGKEELQLDIVIRLHCPWRRGTRVDIRDHGVLASARQDVRDNLMSSMYIMIKDEELYWVVHGVLCGVLKSMQRKQTRARAQRVTLPLSDNHRHHQCLHTFRITVVVHDTRTKGGTWWCCIQSQWYIQKAGREHSKRVNFYACKKERGWVLYAGTGVWPGTYEIKNHCFKTQGEADASYPSSTTKDNKSITTKQSLVTTCIIRCHTTGQQHKDLNDSCKLNMLNAKKKAILSEGMLSR